MQPPTHFNPPSSSMMAEPPATREQNTLPSSSSMHSPSAHTNWLRSSIRIVPFGGAQKVLRTGAVMGNPIPECTGGDSFMQLPGFVCAIAFDVENNTTQAVTIIRCTHILYPSRLQLRCTRQVASRILRSERLFEKDGSPPAFIHKPCLGAGQWRDTEGQKLRNRQN